MKGILEHEQAILSAVLKEPKLTRKILLQLNEDRFTEGINRDIYEAMIEIFSEGKAVDALAVMRRVDTKKHPGIEEYVKELVGNFFTRRGILDLRALDDWVLFVDNAGRLRQAGLVIQTYAHTFGDINALLGEIENPDVYLSEMIGKLRLSQKNKNEGFRSFDEVSVELSERIFKGLSGEVSDRYQTGWDHVDSVLAGGIPKGLIVVCGLPGTGKTQLVIQLLYELIKCLGKGCVAIQSLEMSSWKIFQRLACAYAEVDSREITAGGLSPDSPAVTRLISTINEIKQYPIYIDDNDLVSSSAIDYQASALHTEKGPLCGLMVDYAELVKQHKDEQGLSEELRVSGIFRKGHSLAKQLDMPVFLLSQYSRSVAFRDTKLGTNFDIRYSGAAEAAAHSIWHIYNPYQLREMHIDVSPPSELPLVTERAYVLVGKDKDAGAGTMQLGWVPKYTKWFNPPTQGLGSKSKIFDLDKEDF